MKFSTRKTRLRVPGTARQTLSGLLATAVSYAACGAEHLPFAAPAPASIPGSPAGLLRVAFGLALVLALVFAAAWAMRRLRVLQGGGSDGITVLAQTSLGARERAILVQVGTHKLLLGAGPGSVRTLLVLPADPAAASQAPPAATTTGSGVGAAGAPVRPTFTDLLKRSLGK